MRLLILDHCVFHMLIKFGQKNISFLFLGLQGSSFFLFNIFFGFFSFSFCDNVVGKNARKLLMIFLNDEFIFWGVFFFPSFFSFFRFCLFFYKK